MKKTIVLIACLYLLAASTAPSQTRPEDWENPAAVHAGTEAPRATFVPFPDAASALRLGPKESPRDLSLNGPWKFHWSPRPATGPSISGSLRPTSAAGKKRLSPRTGCSRATIIRSMSTSLMNSPAIPNRRSFRTITTRSAPTAGRSRSPRIGPGWTSISTSARSSRSSTSGSTAKRSASARTPRRPPSGTSPSSSSRARTSWRPRSTAGRTAPISNARTSGGWPASSATSISTPRPRSASATSRSGPDSTRATGMGALI